MLINLFEPWMDGPDADSPVGVSTTSPHEPEPEPGPNSGSHPTIRDIGTRARARLETLIRVYYLRHSFDALDVMLIMFLLLLGSISMRVLTSPPPPPPPPPPLPSTSSSPPSPSPPSPPSPSTTATPPNEPTNPAPQTQTHNRDASTFLLCAKGLHDQGRSQYLGTLMFDVLARLVENLSISSGGGGSSSSSISGGGGGAAADASEALRAGLERVAGEFRGVEVKREYVHMEWPVYRWVDEEGRGLGVLLGEGVEEVEGVVEEVESDGRVDGGSESVGGGGDGDAGGDIGVDGEGGGDEKKGGTMVRE